MKILKKLTAFLLAVVMMFTLSANVLAREFDSKNTMKEREALTGLNFFVKFQKSACTLCCFVI